MTRRRRRTGSHDSGASLILTIGFVLMIGATSGGLASLITSSLNNRNTLERVRDREYAADGAIERAISRVRSDPALICAPSGGSIVDDADSANWLNDVAIRVDWRSACLDNVPSLPTGTTSQRNVIFAACERPASDLRCNEANVIVRAQVNFAPASGAVTKTFIQSWSVDQ